MDDRLKFRERLRVCADKAGSIYALAQKAGFPANTLRRYLVDSEPTRPKLIAIAKAAGVSVQWLATGEQDVGISSNPEVPKDTIWIDGFRERFQLLIEKHGGLERFCHTYELNRVHCESFLKNGQHLPILLVGFAGNHMLPLRWLIAGSYDDNHPDGIGLSEHFESRQLVDFSRTIAAVDEERLFTGEINNEKVWAIQTSPWGWRTEILKLLKSIYEYLPPSHYDVLEYNKTFGSSFAKDGDIVVVDKTELRPTNGLLVMKFGSPPDGFHQIMKVSNVGGEPRMVKADGSHEPLPEMGAECIGRVILIVRKYL